MGHVAKEAISSFVVLGTSLSGASVSADVAGAAVASFALAFAKCDGGKCLFLYLISTLSSNYAECQ
jgi:mannose/fructose/N-acetylgalactosamine-specific phosphotransferase system component IIC